MTINPIMLPHKSYYDCVYRIDKYGSPEFKYIYTWFINESYLGRSPYNNYLGVL